MIITHSIKLELDRCGDISRIDAAQGDASTRQVRVELHTGSGPWAVPAGVQPLVRFRRPDGGSGAYDTLPDGSAACAVSGNIITAALVPEMFTAAGIVTADICLIREGAVLSTFPFQVHVHPGAGSRLTPEGDYRHVSGFVPMPEPAAEGQYIRVTEVDEYGTVRAVDTAPLDEAPVQVPENEYLDMTGLPRNAFRRAFHLGSAFGPGEHEYCRVNRLAVLATPGSTVRFALFRGDREGNSGTLTQLAVLGSATADSGSGLAELVFVDGYVIDREDAVILALAAEPVIACYEAEAGMTVMDGLWFEDADYSQAEDGTVISCVYTTGLESDPKTACALSIRDMDYVSTRTLGAYIRETGIRLQNAGSGGNEDGDCGLPAVTASDNGRYLRVVNGLWTAADSAAPVFDLSAMGMGSVTPDGVMAQITVDTAAIRAALDRGPVRFAVPVNIGVPISAFAVMNAVRAEDGYCCTCLTEFDGELLYITVHVSGQGIGVTVRPNTALMDAYMEEALGGDY